MSDYDAFGRKTGDDPLSDLGWSSSSPPDTPQATQPAPSVDVAPASSDVGWRPPTTGVPTYRVPRRRRGGGLLAGIIALLIVGGVGLAIFSAVDAGRNAVEGVIDDVRTATDAATGSGGADVAIEETDGRGGEPGKVLPLTNPKGLRAGLRKLQREVPGRVQSFRLEASRIDITVWRPGGRLRTAQLQADAEAPQVFSTTGSGFPKGTTFTYADVSPSAPMRLIRTANRRFGKRSAQVNYLVLGHYGSGLTWGVYYKDGSIAQGDRRGRYTRRIG